MLKFFNGGYGNNSYSWKWKSKEGDPTYLLLLGGTRRSESQFVSQLGAHAGEGKVKLGKIQRSVIFNWSMRSCMIPNTIHIAMKPKSINHSKGKRQTEWQFDIGNKEIRQDLRQHLQCFFYENAGNGLFMFQENWVSLPACQVICFWCNVGALLMVSWSGSFK